MHTMANIYLNWSGNKKKLKDWMRTHMDLQTDIVTSDISLTGSLCDNMHCLQKLQQSPVMSWKAVSN